MFFTNLSDKQLIIDSLCSSPLMEFQVVNSQLNGMILSDNSWAQGNINNCNINEAVFHNLSLNEVQFLHSSLMSSRFSNSRWTNSSFSGNTLIKTVWSNCRLLNLRIAQCSMQRVKIEKTIFNNSSFIDFEGIYAEISNTVFNNCHFEINYGNGMNGFSGASFDNCLFINCTFNGFPLRGSKVNNCTLVRCSGEISDDIDCNDTFSDSIELIRLCSPIRETQLFHRHESERFISEVK